jgi:hypothetical protein
VSPFAQAATAILLALPAVAIAIFARAARNRIEDAADDGAECHGAGGGEPFHGGDE